MCFRTHVVLIQLTQAFLTGHGGPIRPARPALAITQALRQHADAGLDNDDDHVVP